MMMFRILPITSLILLAACSGTKIEPVAYNDSLVTQQIKIVEKANELQDAFSGYVRAEMEIRQKDFASQLERSEAVVKRLGSYGDDKRLFKATEDFIEGYRKLNENEYKEAIRILSEPDSLYSEVDEAKISLIFKTIDDRITKLGAEFLEAQKSFAKDHQLEIDPQAQAE